MSLRDPRSPRLRPAVRALIHTPDHDVLLVRFRFPGIAFWAPPGGGIEPGEPPLEALRRELAEEVGLLEYTVGPKLYEHRRLYGADAASAWDGQADDVYLIAVPERFEPRPAMSAADLIAENLVDTAWFTVGALEALGTLPVDLGARVRRLREHGPPAVPDRFGIPGG
ncbi:MAG: NUDIX hydrolase [Myxococcota bacterium]